MPSDKSCPLANFFLTVALCAAMAVIGSAATADTQNRTDPLIAKIGDEARSELLATTGTLRISQLESLSDSQIKLGDTVGAKKSIDALKAVLTQSGPVDSFQFDKAIELSVRLEDDVSILATIDNLPADAKIKALGTYGTIKAKASNATAVDDAVARIEAILRTLPPDPPIVQLSPPPLYPQAHVYTRHGADLAYWHVGVAAAENGNIPLAQKMSDQMTNDLLRLRVLAAIARRQLQNHATDQSAATLADLKKLAEATAIDHSQAISTAVTAFAGCGDLNMVLALAPELAQNDLQPTMNAAARQFLTDKNPSAFIDIATKYPINSDLIPKAIDQIYRQGGVAEAKKAYQLAFASTLQKVDQPPANVGQQIDRMSLVTTLIDGEIAIHDFTAATDHLRMLLPNSTASLGFGTKIVAAEIEDKDKAAINNTVEVTAFFIQNFPGMMASVNLDAIRALAKAGYDDAAQKLLRAANEYANRWQGTPKIAMLKLLNQIYTDIGDQQAAADTKARIEEISSAPPPLSQAPAAPPRRLSDAEIEKAKQLKAAADILNEPNNGSREAQQALISRAMKAVNNDGQALEVAIFAGALLNPNARATRNNQNLANDLIKNGQLNEAISVAETINGIGRNVTLQQIAVEQAKSGDLQAAYATIPHINDPETHAGALAAVLEAAAQYAATVRNDGAN